MLINYKCLLKIVTKTLHGKNCEINEKLAKNVFNCRSYDVSQNTKNILKIMVEN